MIRKLMLSAALLALVGFTSSTSLSAPQGKGAGGGGGHGGGGGGGHGGGNPGGGHGGYPGQGHYPGNYPGYPGYYPGYPGYYPGYGYGYGLPLGGLAGFALGRGFGYGGGGVGSYSSPYYYPSNSSTSAYGSYDNQPPPFEPASTQARITVMLPAEAKLWVGEYVSTLTGSARVLITPVLDPSQSYSYMLVAKWNEDGREVSRTREVKFRAGESMTVDMTQSEPTSPPPTPSAPPPKPVTPGKPMTPPVPSKIQ
jgi:uncharacterized protein (TIGR03000 family)